MRIVEVGPRDGLQNEKQTVPTATKLELIERLVASGLARHRGDFVRVAEVGAADGRPRGRSCAACEHRRRVNYPVLTPNLKGFEAAVAAGATEVAVFAAASEGFSQKNINCSIAESIDRFVPRARGRAGARV